MKHVLVLLPLAEELDALSSSLVDLGQVVEQKQIGTLIARCVPARNLTLAICGHGKAQAAVQAQYLIQALYPLDLVVCCGAAGSLNPDVGVGDLVAAIATVEHDYTLRFAQRPDPRFPGDEKTITELRNAFSTQGTPFQLHFSLIASGDEDVVTTERARELAQQTSAVCVAWEGAGVARACRFNNVPFLELRAVTDLADKSASSDFDLNLAQAMRNLAWLLHHWLA